jgi:signal transduction histidine kinase
VNNGIKQGRQPRQQKEYVLWLQRIEKRAILPLKWIILMTTLLVWLWGTNWVLPSPGVFTLFLLYGMFNFALSYFFYFNRLEYHQIKMVCLISYMADILFITSLVYADVTFHYGTAMQADFYVLYFLLILRGFALFQSAIENMIMSGIIAVLFLVTIALQNPEFDFLAQQGFVLKFTLIWMVALMSWFIVESINQQKAELMRIREKLINSQHLAHLGEIAANMAHEINNPVGIIAAYSEFLLRDTPRDDVHRDDFETIRHEALRCSTIISRLLNYARPAAREIVKCRLDKMNDEVIAMLFREKHNPNVNVQKEYPDVVPEILADCEQLKQALVNVYLNAREAINNRGTIQTDIRVIEKSEKHEGQDVIELSIKDSGKGFSRGSLEQAFDPFFSERDGGTGLGLTITRQIIEAHQGSISVQNHPSDGAEIRIILPTIPG